MSQEEDKSQKTQAPTEQKLQELRRKGEIPRSGDLNSAVAMGGLTILAFLFGGQILTSMGDTMQGFFRIWDHGDPSGGLGGGIIRQMVTRVVVPPMALIVAAGAVVILAVLAQRGFAVAPEKLVPKQSRISILKTAKQKFGPSGLFEFAKSLTKLIVFTFVLVVVTLGFQEEILGSSFGEAGPIVAFKLDLMIRILAASTAVAMALGGIDLLWQRQHFMTTHMMSRQDIKDEMKRAEGDPEQKAERKRRGKEISQNRMLTDVPAADVVVVNPTHYAVALRWARDKQAAAPVCVAKGTDLIAAKIREIAQENAVPLFSDPPTARALHAGVEVGQEIAFEHYQAVAAAIRFADKIRQKSKAMK